MAQETETSAEEEVERIQVTGSRIKRIGELAPTPVTVIGGDALIDAGVNNVADLLNDLPSSSVGISPETSNNTIFASGLNNTDLRGLGVKELWYWLMAVASLGDHQAQVPLI